MGRRLVFLGFLSAVPACNAPTAETSSRSASEPEAPSATAPSAPPTAPSGEDSITPDVPVPVGFADVTIRGRYQLLTRTPALEITCETLTTPPLVCELTVTKQDETQGAFEKTCADFGDKTVQCIIDDGLRQQLIKFGKDAQLPVKGGVLVADVKQTLSATPKDKLITYFEAAVTVAESTALKTETPKASLALAGDWSMTRTCASGEEFCTPSVEPVYFGPFDSGSKYGIWAEKAGHDACFKSSEQARPELFLALDGLTEPLDFTSLETVAPSLARLHGALPAVVKTKLRDLVEFDREVYSLSPGWPDCGATPQDPKCAPLGGGLEGYVRVDEPFVQRRLSELFFGIELYYGDTVRSRAKIDCAPSAPVPMSTCFSTVNRFCDSLTRTKVDLALEVGDALERGLPPASYAPCAEGAPEAEYVKHATFCDRMSSGFRAAYIVLAGGGTPAVDPIVQLPNAPDPLDPFDPYYASSESKALCPAATAGGSPTAEACRSEFLGKSVAEQVALIMPATLSGTAKASDLCPDAVDALGTLEDCRDEFLALSPTLRDLAIVAYGTYGEPNLYEVACVDPEFTKSLVDGLNRSCTPDFDSAMVRNQCSSGETVSCNAVLYCSGGLGSTSAPCLDAAGVPNFRLRSSLGLFDYAETGDGAFALTAFTSLEHVNDEGEACKVATATVYSSTAAASDRFASTYEYTDINQCYISDGEDDAVKFEDFGRYEFKRVVL